ncbi:hypothetical protein B0J12DRAFT_406297 [Macrophomina phaseolina]|uniref:Uncharacterized protein n=1 Tax=Macrophomina phaseolina TaxID=35725 RepID=A0ABQ8GIV3_9PEZI|nr:hypothetical protein B0J12DRAFT_406297 [Macrophomina phaseolina]
MDAEMTPVASRAYRQAAFSLQFLTSTLISSGLHRSLAAALLAAPPSAGAGAARRASLAAAPLPVFYFFFFAIAAAASAPLHRLGRAGVDRRPWRWCVGRVAASSDAGERHRLKQPSNRRARATQHPTDKHVPPSTRPLRGLVLWAISPHCCSPAPEDVISLTSVRQPSAALHGAGHAAHAGTTLRVRPSHAASSPPVRPRFKVHAPTTAFIYCRQLSRDLPRAAARCRFRHPAASSHGGSSPQARCFDVSAIAAGRRAVPRAQARPLSSWTAAATHVGAAGWADAVKTRLRVGVHASHHGASSSL